MRHIGRIAKIDRDSRIIQVLCGGKIREIDWGIFENRYMRPEQNGMKIGAEIEFGFNLIPKEDSPDIPGIEHFARVLNVPTESDEWIKEGF